VTADDGHLETCEITSVERKDLKPETLGLTLAEGKAILKDIQEIVIQQQTAICLASYRECPDCGNPRTGNGYHDLSVRTVFGYLKVKSARLHHCGCRPHESKTFSPLADLLPERTTPELTLPSECVSLSGRVLGNLHPTPWSSWRWKCGNRRSDFQGLWEGWENSLIVFPGFPQAAISMACLNRSRRHAAIFAEAPIQSCSNSTGLT
jgi:hypothetical protein